MQSSSSKKTASKKIPRPSNSWILYRSATIRAFRLAESEGREYPLPPKVLEALQQSGHVFDRTVGICRTSANPIELQTIISAMWKQESEEVKKEFHAMSALVKKKHAELYPDYVYAPKRKSTSTSSAFSSQSTVNTVSASTLSSIPTFITPASPLDHSDCGSSSQSSPPVSPFAMSFPLGQRQGQLQQYHQQQEHCHQRQFETDQSTRLVKRRVSSAVVNTLSDPWAFSAQQYLHPRASVSSSDGHLSSSSYTDQAFPVHRLSWSGSDMPDMTYSSLSDSSTSPCQSPAAYYPSKDYLSPISACPSQADEFNFGSSYPMCSSPSSSSSFCGPAYTFAPSFSELSFQPASATPTTTTYGYPAVQTNKSSSTFLYTDPSYCDPYETEPQTMVYPDNIIGWTPTESAPNNGVSIGTGVMTTSLPTTMEPAWSTGWGNEMIESVADDQTVTWSLVDDCLLPVGPAC
ncbi:HMG-box transcription factor [Phaffia rhodozyma]|uniref:HMG-box transcription factor n=1 Tax=Phaffia rhodozyma TaxID=264483 RepID=A0A0F7SV85_PHARH|nr:HMG-box transcription factor [Phaffia rhodozyma]